MHLELSISTSQELVPEVTQETSPNLRKEFAERQAASADGLLGALQQSPVGGYNLSVDRVEALLTVRSGPDNARLLAGVLKMNDVAQAALLDPIGMSAFGEKDALRLSVAYMYADAERRGGFRFERQGIPTQVRVVRALLEEAVSNPHGLRTVLEEKQQLVRSSRSMTEGMQLTIREHLDALDVANVLRPRFQTVAKSIAVAHKIEDDSGRPFRDFFDDLAVLRSLGVVCADAIQRQFASRMTDGLTQGEEFADVRLALLNPVARHALLAMGVVEPSIQRLFKHCYDRDALDRERAKFKSRKVDALLDKRDLRQRDELFWLRRQQWNLPPRGGGTLAFDTVSELVRADGDAALSALGAEDLFREARAVAFDAGRGKSEKADDRDVARVQVRGMLASSLTSQRFVAYLADRLPLWSKVLCDRLSSASVDPRFAALTVQGEEDEDS